GEAIMIEILTDNKNRSSAEIKHILSKNGHALATPGSCSWAFHKEGKEWLPQTTVEISAEDGAKLEALIDELEENDEVQEIFHNGL
ncbi:MAG: YebC/PmpR family DNA-binding transcriptional regulator, partial [Patescibacteria group bacterium]